MISQLLRSKFLGALIGTGVGDALGAPFEGRYKVSPEEIEVVADNRQVLTYTDDTHMMIGVAESLIRASGFDGADMAQTFAQNYELEPYRGYGPGSLGDFLGDDTGTSDVTTIPPVLLGYEYAKVSKLAKKLTQVIGILVCGVNLGCSWHNLFLNYLLHLLFQHPVALAKSDYHLSSL